MINRTEKSLLHGCFTRKCNTQLPPHISATSGATPTQPPSLKAASMLVLERNKACNTHAISSEKDAQQAPQKEGLKVVRVAPESGYETGKLPIEPTLADERIDKVLAQLESDPGLRYAMETHSDIEPNAVLLTLAIRGKGACELRIPKSRYDGIALLELIEKHTTRETLQ